MERVAHQQKDLCSLLIIRKIDFVTGLDNLILNPYSTYDPKSLIEDYRLNSTWALSHIQDIIDREHITEQTYYEIKHGVDKDYYTSELRGPTMFNTRMGAEMTHAIKNSKPTYLQKFTFTLNDRANRIEGGTQRTDLGLKLAKIHPGIANTKEEANAAKHRFFISEKDEAMRERIDKSKLVNEAVFKLYTLLNRNSSFNIYRVASLLTTHAGRPFIKGDVNEEALHYRLNTYIHDDTTHRMSNIVKFLKAMKLFDTKETKELFNIMYTIQQALNYEVLILRDGWFIWPSKADQPNLYKLGVSKDKVLNFFLKQKKELGSDDTVTNWYRDLADELRKHGARLK